LQSVEQIHTFAATPTRDSIKDHFKQDPLC
jgi:hypothetical protein